MTLRWVLLLLLLSLFSTSTFAKPSWKLVEVEDDDEAQNEDAPDQQEADRKDEKNSDQDDNDYRAPPGGPPPIWPGRI